MAAAQSADAGRVALCSMGRIAVAVDAGGLRGYGVRGGRAAGRARSEVRVVPGDGVPHPEYGSYRTAA